MQLRADQQEFATAVGWVAKGLPRHTGTPILLGLLLTAGPDGATISGTDQAVSARISLHCQIDAEGTCLVPGRILAEITKLLPPGPVTLTADGHRFAISCGDAVYSLPLLPLADYPATGSPAAEYELALEAGAFAAAVEQVAVSAARDDVVPALTGINLNFSGDAVELASTDRYRLGIARVEVTEQANPYEVLVPAKVLAELTRAFAGDGGRLLLSLTGETFHLRNTTRSAWVRTLTGPYPSYRRIVPQHTPISATVDRLALRDVVRRLSVVADGMTPIWLEHGAGTLRVRAGSDDDASGAETLASTGTGDALTIAFTAHLLLDAINSFDSAKLTTAYTGARKPAVLTGANGNGEPDCDYLHVLTPRLLPQ
ncbi:DNA polymerase III subunit beta [Kribbella monticola]|uniref:DNA polymerase III subunit beta n=1 Tax=Kribbella monticola TaxID=2185285 RepID=UPI0013004CE4|nr:DNA polymerase III subunit beta [Kribbella monticola]